MTKSALKVGYVVKLRSGRFCMVLPAVEGLCLSGPDDWFPIARLTDDLKYKGSRFCDSPERFDVVEVYGLSKYNSAAHQASTTFRDLLWKREEKPPAKKMTVTEVCKALGYEVEIVKDGADQ